MQIPSFNPTPEIELLWNEINNAIQKVLQHGQFILGPEVEEFEKKVADYIGVKYAIGVNSGTDALVIGMRAAGIGAGDEVITTPFSFFATAESISTIGAKPVFVDINESTFNIEPDKIEQAITQKTKAILPVHLYGKPAVMSKIKELAEKHSLKVIEDCAQSFGAVYYGECSECDDQDCTWEGKAKIKGKKTGSIGDLGAFSFFPTKNLGGIGDGGMITTDDDEIDDMARMLRTHGSRKKYQNERLGFNSRLDTIQAAVLLKKLNHVDEFNKKRLNIVKAYNQKLKDIDEIVPPKIGRGDVFHQYTLRIKNGKRDEVKEKLAEKGISSSVYYPVPQDQLPVYEGKYSRFPVSDLLSREVLSLPLWPGMEPGTVVKIAEGLIESLKDL